MGVTLGWILAFCIIFMAFWCLLFLFTIVIPGSIKLFLLNKLAPKFIRELAGLEEGEKF